MKTYTLEDLQEFYNEKKLLWGHIDTKDFLEMLKFREDKKE